ncbi:HAD family hydrolase [Burkholderia pyrrocinia]|uniref:HAD family hydrolase n=1 Tax=Burkholderia pyrrocinia TaxID=60550 RepID=UPI0030D15260
MISRVVLCDADNTLWDTDSVFAEAQDILLNRVEAIVGVKTSARWRVEFVRQYDQALAEKHHLHFRYPPIMLVFALTDGLLGTSPDAAAAAAMIGNRGTRIISIQHAEKLVAEYLAALDQTPILLPSVKEGLLCAIAAKLNIYVLTEGRIERQREIIRWHGIESAFDGVLEITKTTSQFQRLRERFASASVTVIGDQPDRDISPALSAGCSAVLVPSRFRPRWHTSSSWKGATYVASDFSDAITWLTEIAEPI